MGSGGVGRCICGEYESCAVCVEDHRRASASRIRREVDEEVAATARRLAECIAEIDNLKDFREALEQKLVAHLGDRESITGPWGEFSYPWRRGRVAWTRLWRSLPTDRPVCIDDELKNEFRGAPWREARLRLKDDEGKDER